MKWRKLSNWLPAISGYTHAAMPFYFEGDVYYSPRRNGLSEIWRASFNLKTLTMGTPELYLPHGKDGEYDDYGAMVSWLKRDAAGRILCYFVGWNRPVNVAFRNCIGVALNGHKLYGPLKDRNLYDTVGVGACCDGLRWYVSLLGWERRDLRLEPRYHIVNGNPHSPAITFKNHETEWAIARPCVIQDGDLYRMWYCYRGLEYRIGYAESKDGLQWERKDEEAGITIGEHGAFDDEAVAYPHVFDSDGQRYMLWTGNG